MRDFRLVEQTRSLLSRFIMYPGAGGKIQEALTILLGRYPAEDANPQSWSRLPEGLPEGLPDRKNPPCVKNWRGLPNPRAVCFDVELNHGGAGSRQTYIRKALRL